MTGESSAAQILKTRGNRALWEHDLGAATICFSLALDLDPTNPTYFCNRATTFLLEGKAQAALVDAETAVRLDRTPGRGFYHKGLALYALKCYNEAVVAFNAGTCQSE